MLKVIFEELGRMFLQLSGMKLAEKEKVVAVEIAKGTSCDCGFTPAYIDHDCGKLTANVVMDEEALRLKYLRLF